MKTGHIQLNLKGNVMKYSASIAAILSLALLSGECFAEPPGRGKGKPGAGQRDGERRQGKPGQGRPGPG